MFNDPLDDHRPGNTSSGPNLNSAQLDLLKEANLLPG